MKVTFFFVFLEVCPTAVFTTPYLQGSGDINEGTRPPRFRRKRPRGMNMIHCLELLWYLFIQIVNNFLRALAVFIFLFLRVPFGVCGYGSTGFIVSYPSTILEAFPDCRERARHHALSCARRLALTEVTLNSPSFHTPFPTLCRSFVPV